jgi:hypothetical protein
VDGGIGLADGGIATDAMGQCVSNCCPNTERNVRGVRAEWQRKRMPAGVAVVVDGVEEGFDGTDIGSGNIGLALAGTGGPSLNSNMSEVGSSAYPTESGAGDVPYGRSTMLRAGEPSDDGSRFSLATPSPRTASSQRLRSPTMSTNGTFQFDNLVIDRHTHEIGAGELGLVAVHVCNLWQYHGRTFRLFLAHWHIHEPVRHGSHSYGFDILAMEHACVRENLALGAVANGGKRVSGCTCVLAVLPDISRAKVLSWATSPT